MPHTAPRLLRCVVAQDKMDKSRVGKIVRLVRHPLVGKYIKRTTRVMFHDENNETHQGDEVYIHQCRPLSARKCYTLHGIIHKKAQ